MVEDKGDLVVWTNDPDVQRYIHNPMKSVQINEGNLSSELAENPGWIARFSNIASYAKKQTAIFKIKLDVAMANAYLKHKDNGHTDKTCGELTKIDPDVINAKLNLSEAEYFEDMMIGATRSYAHRETSLQSLGSLKKQELRTGVVMFEENDKARQIMGGGE